MTRGSQSFLRKGQSVYDTVFNPESRNAGNQIHQQLPAPAPRWLGALLRSRSHSPTPWQPRLPTEVWCAIWAWLPFSACITVTHTCRSWRRVALACPALWTHLRFCATITGNLTLQGDLDGELGDAGSAYVSSASEILARSHNLHLHVTFDVPAQNPSPTLISALGMVLSQAAHRIASMTVRTADADAAYALMRELRSLSVLRIIVFQRRNVTSRFSPFFASSAPFIISAPSLTDVELGPGFHWPSNGPQFPNVRRISLTPGYDIRREIALALGACPVLQYLTIDLVEITGRTSDSGVSAPQRRYASLRAARFINASASSVPVALSISHALEIPAISLSAGIASCGLAGTMFRDLGVGVRLSVLRCPDNQVTVAANDCEGRARCVSCTETIRLHQFRDKTLHTMLHQHIDWRTVATLSVSLAHWYHFVEVFPGAPAVTRLKVFLGSATQGRVFDEEPMVYNANTTPDKFPALQMLDIVGAGAASRMTADELAVVVRKLDINLPLASLSVDHTVFMGSRASLRAVARKVCIRTYRVGRGRGGES